ncbi:NUDIX domain-containing protein [Arthrobacter sp. 7Tela_A1]
MISSAGILLYRFGRTSEDAGRDDAAAVRVWIAHMGGPFWARKDDHAWSVPKGEFVPPEDALAAAKREFGEEMGWPAPDVEYQLLGTFRQSSAKTITVFAAEADFPDRQTSSNTFELEWPPRPGTLRSYPEVDRAGWFTVDEARTKLVKGQVQLLDALAVQLRGGAER